VDHRGKKRSYAFPCNVTTIQGVDYTKRLKESGLVAYARDGGNNKSVISDLKSIDPMKVPSWHVMADTKTADLIAFAEEVKRLKGVGIYQFHDVDGSLFSISGKTHRELLQYLKAHADDFEVMTFGKAMEVVNSAK
jgi:hypothetical protein